MRPAPVHRLRLCAFVWLLAANGVSVRADPRVAVIATAREEYVERRMADGKPRRETYVFMQGNFYGGATVDRSLERMPFRKIVEFLAPELAKQEYQPTTQTRDADLLLVVHWGATVPYVGTQEMMGRTSAMTDTSTSTSTFNQSNREALRGELTGTANEDSGTHAPMYALADGLSTDSRESAMAMMSLTIRDTADVQRISDRLEQLTDHISKDTTRGDNKTLLGYNETMHRLSKQMWTDASERILQWDLESERYFIIVNAYDLKDKAAGSARPVWKMHLNISSPGNNFSTALNRMSQVAGDYAGRNTGTVISIRPRQRDGKVTLAPMIILGEVKPPPKE